jgi:hypothetical protein
MIGNLSRGKTAYLYFISEMDYLRKPQNMSRGEDEAINREAGDDELERCAEVIRRGFMTVRRIWFDEEKSRQRGFLKTGRLLSERAKAYPICARENGDIVGFVQLERSGRGDYFWKSSPTSRNSVQGLREGAHDFARERVRESAGKNRDHHHRGKRAAERLYIKSGYVHTRTKKFEHLPFPGGS